MNKLQPIEQAFVNEYTSNGHNGTQAYLKVRPGTSYETAMVLASRWLSKVKFKDAVDQAVAENSVIKLYPKISQANRFRDLSLKSEERGNFSVAVNAEDKICQLAGHYESDSGEADYTTFIQNIFNAPVQVNHIENEPAKGKE